MINIAILLASVASFVLVVALAFSVVRKAMITHTASLQKETDQSGEILTWHVQFTVLDNPDSMQAKLREVMAIGDGRRAFNFGRYNEAIEAAKAAQAAQAAAQPNVKSVK